jgi:hypothetical protein
VNAKDVQLSLSLVGQPALPYEPIRVRLTLKNVSRARVGPMVRIEDFGSFEIKGPGDKHFKMPSWELSDPDQPIPDMPDQHADAPNILGPGEQTSVSFAFAADWDKRDERCRNGCPLTPEPGDYTIKCSFDIDVKKKTLVEKTLDIEVRKPKTADDAAVYDMLKKDPALAGAIMQSVGAPDKDTVAKLEQLLVHHKRSTYADYARFAVARYGVRSKDEQLYADAVKELKSLAGRDFAYRPNAIIALIKTGPQDLDDLKALMNREYFDSIEWLEFVAKDMKAQEWKEFRKLTPDKAKEWAKRKKDGPAKP